MKRNYLIGIDIGTHSSKGVLVDFKGNVLRSHVVQHRMEMPYPGFFEHDANEVWWGDFAAIIKVLLEQPNIKPNMIAGIGVSAIGSCVLPIDKNGTPLRKGILYGIDTRAEKEIKELEDSIGKETIYTKAGVHLSAQSSGPKILWIRNNEKEVFKKTRWFLTSQAYIVYKLTNTPTIDIYTAGSYAPLFNVNTMTWDVDCSQRITSLETLPNAMWSCDIAGTVTSAAAKETGLAEGTPVIVGTTDAAAEAVSAGVSQSGDMMIMFGSSAFFIMKTKDLIQTENFWSSHYLEKDTYAFTGGMSTTGSLTTWFRDEFAKLEFNSFSLLAEEAAKSPAGSNGLILLPYFEGERTPLHDPKAKGVLFGLSIKHSRSDIYRAILEGVGFGIRHNIDVMNEEGVIPKRYIAVGGGTKNRLWLQIVADIAGIELFVPEQQIGASYGDAFMAGVGIGEFKSLHDVEKWVNEGTVIKAGLKLKTEYNFNYQIFRSLYDSTKAMMHALSDHQSEIRVENNT